MTALQSSNPLLANEHLASVLGTAEASPTTASVSGVINKTTALVLAAVVAGAAAYAWTTNAGMGAVSMLWMASGLVSLVVFFTMWRKATISPAMAFVYAIAQGAFLGALSRGLEMILADKGIAVAGGSLALQAFVVTAVMTLGTLFLYRARIIKPTKMFASILSSVVLGIGLIYLAGFVLSFFSVQIPYLTLNSAFEGGNAAWIGLGLNAVILIVAALTLIMDFAQIEAAVESDAPKAMEWYLAFGLVVSMAWIFYEALKLVFRIAILVNDRR